MQDAASIEPLRDAIRHMHGCDSRFVEAIYVSEMHEGRVAWEGTVTVFDLVGHPEASRVYAWSYPTSGSDRRFVAVLGVPPIDGPAMAVRSAILADEQAKLN